MPECISAHSLGPQPPLHIQTNAHNHKILSLLYVQN